MTTLYQLLHQLFETFLNPYNINNESELVSIL